MDMPHHPDMKSSTPRGTRQTPTSSTPGHHHTTTAGARYHQTQLARPSSLPRSRRGSATRAPACPPRPAKIAVELTASPRHTPSEPSSGRARTIPQMWELSRRAAVPEAASSSAMGTSRSGVVVSTVSATTRTTTTVTTTTTTTATATGTTTATRSATWSSTPPTSSRGRGRTRGRPRGSNRSMDCSSMLVRGAHAATSSAVRQPRQARVNAPPLVWGRRAGRPPKPRSPSPRELYHSVRSRFLVFLCEWDGCRAELHNLDTLRRHVHVVHGPRHYPRRERQPQDQHHQQQQQQQQQQQKQQQQQQQPPWTCRWAQCAHKTNNMTVRDTRDWHAHLEEAHFAPFEWHVGDGPRNTSDVLRSAIKNDSVGDNDGGGGAGLSALPDYLMGPDGTQVTPSIRDQELEDFATWKQNRRRLKEMLILRDSNLPDLSSEESDVSD